MEFDFNILKEAGKALKNLGKEEEEEKKDIDLSNTDSDYEAGAEKDVKIPTVTTSEQEEEKRLEDEAKKERESTDKDVDDKIKNIKKVLEAFDDSGGDTQVITPDIVLGKSSDINLRAPDLGAAMSKQYAQQLLNQQPSSQKDRVSLLLQDIYKTL